MNHFIRSVTEACNEWQGPFYTAQRLSNLEPLATMSNLTGPAIEP